MKIKISIILLVIGWQLNVGAQQMKPLGTFISFASIEKGRSLLGTRDDYTAKWSKFDIQSRMQDKMGNKKDLISFGKDQVLAWTVEEEQKIREVFAKIDSLVDANNYFWPLPEKVFLIKSTLLEEGGAGGYTRANYIVLRQDLIFRDDARLQEIILHEIFHVLTRNSVEYRKTFYDIIGFTVSNPIPIPPEIASLRITNPDAHLNDSYIRLRDTTDRNFEAIMVLFSDRAWDGGLFFQYLQIGLLEVFGEDGNKSLQLNEGKAVIHSMDAVTNFFDQVGKNTRYIIDPEEILADNFAYVFDEKEDRPDPQIVTKIRAVLMASE